MPTRTTGDAAEVVLRHDAGANRQRGVVPKHDLRSWRRNVVTFDLCAMFPRRWNIISRRGAPVLRRDTIIPQRETFVPRR